MISLNDFYSFKQKRAGDRSAFLVMAHISPPRRRARRGS